MQECTGTNIHDNVCQYSKDTMFARDTDNSSTQQLNHTYLESMIAHDQTKQDNNTQPYSFGSDIFGQTLRHLGYNNSCSKCSINWLHHVNETPKKKQSNMLVDPQTHHAVKKHL